MAFKLNPHCGSSISINQHINAIKASAPQQVLVFKKCENSSCFEAEASLNLKLGDIKFLKCHNNQKSPPSDGHPTKCPSEVLVRSIAHRCVEGVSSTESLITVHIGVQKDFRQQYKRKCVRLKSLLSVRITVNAQVKKKMERLIDARSFDFSVVEGNWKVGDNCVNPVRQNFAWLRSKAVELYFEAKTEWVKQYDLQLKARDIHNWPGNYADYKITADVVLWLFVNGLQGRVFLPTYFTRPIFNPLIFQGGDHKVYVMGEHGAKFQCAVTLLKKCSAVWDTQLDARWEGESLREVKIVGLSNEGMEALEEFLKFGHVGPTTENFAMAVELLETAHAYMITKLQEKLLDLFFIQPLENFTDPVSLVALYSFLEKSQISTCVHYRVGGIVKLKGKEILECEEIKNWDPSIMRLIKDRIASYDVVLDRISYWVDFHKWLKDTKSRKKYFKKHADINERYPQLICNRHLLGLSHFYKLHENT